MQGSPRPPHDSRCLPSPVLFCKQWPLWVPPAVIDTARGCPGHKGEAESGWEPAVLMVLGKLLAALVVWEREMVALVTIWW